MKHLPATVATQVDSDNAEAFSVIDLDQVRSFGYRMVDIIVKHLASSRERPIFPPALAAQEASAALAFDDAPHGPAEPLELLDRLERYLLPASGNVLHPGIMSWVMSTPLPIPSLLDGLTSSLCLFPYTARLTPGSIELELTVCRWLGRMTGYADDAFGYLTSGGTMANLYGLAAARSSVVGVGVGRNGTSSGPLLTVYASVQAHFCIERALALMGIGSAQLRRIPVDADFAMQAPLLREAIRRDRQMGHLPLCIVGTAGTTLTGAVDHFDELADIAAAEGVWLHVDGAYGALGALDPRRRFLFRGIERANSLALDPHKWLNVPFGVGCILVKDKAALARAFHPETASYMRGNDSGGHDHWHYGFEMARPDRATKVWLAINLYGVDGYAALVSRHHGFASRLYDLFVADPEFEPLHRPALSVLCFRYVGKGLGAVARDAVNREVEAALRGGLQAFVAGAEFDGHPVLRVCFVNHRTTWDDVLRAVDAVRDLGRRLSAQAGPAA